MSTCKCCKVSKLPVSFKPWMELCDNCFLSEQGVTYEEYYKWLYSSPSSRTVPRYKATTKINPYRTYKDQIKLLTEGVKNQIPSIELRNYLTYHIDHKISSAAGFILGISPEDISHLSNLRIITASDNRRKGMISLVDESNKWILDKYKLTEESLKLTPNDLKRSNK